MDPRGKVVEAVTLLLCAIVLVIVFLAATAANGLALLVFYRRPSLRTMSNRFVVNLALANLACCVLLVPMLLADAVRGHDQAPSPGLCAASEGVAAAVCACSVFAVLMVAADQYCAVLHPLRYHARLSKVRSAAMILSSWLLAIILGVLGALRPWHDEPGSSLWHACGTEPAYFAIVSHHSSSAKHVLATARRDYPFSHPATLYRTSFAMLYALVAFLLPFGAIVCIYYRIYSAAHLNSKRTRKNGSGSITPAGSEEYAPLSLALFRGNVVAVASEGVEGTTTAVSPSVTDNVTLLHPSGVTTPPRNAVSRSTSVKSTSSSIVNTLKYRISNASLFRYREEARAARISVLVVLMALVCWMPYVTVLLLHSGLILHRPTATAAIPHYVDTAALTVLSIGALVSPCLFAYRNRRIQREVRKIFGLRKVDERSATTRRKTTNCRLGSSTSRGMTSNYSHTALELMTSLTESKDSGVQEYRNMCCSPMDANRNSTDETMTSLLSCMKGKIKWNGRQRERVNFAEISENALTVVNSRSSFSSAGSSQATASSGDMEC